MNKSVGTSLAIVLILILSVVTVSATVTVSSPHDTSAGYTCSSCHTVHSDLGGTGYDNICINCHRPGVPNAGKKPFTVADAADPYATYTSAAPAKRYQTSHRWSGSDTVPAAGALPPLFPSMTTSNLRTRTNNSLACVRCHNQHDNTNSPFLRMANDSDQMCLDCHRPRNQRSHVTGTHPVNFGYSSAGSKVRSNPSQYYNPPLNANPVNPSAALPLKNGKLLCTTCHGVHYSDSHSGTADSSSAYNNLSASKGNLLRTDLRGPTAVSTNICTNCHAGKLSHNNRNQNVQCTDCHGGHVDAGDGSTPNVWLVRRFMNYSDSRLLTANRNKPVFFRSTTQTSKNYKDANGNGVCQTCHNIPMGSGFQTFHGVADTSSCNLCHTHGNIKGSFSVDPATACNSCHGYPPRANHASGPDGYGVFNGTPSPFTNESSSGHAGHAFQPYQKACEECHQGNSHFTGTFQDVFLVKGPILNKFPALTPTYTGSPSFSCTNVYCHSNGNPRNGSLTAKTIPSWNNGRGTIIGQATECAFCHDDAATLATNSHRKHLDATIGCVNCHNDTVSSNTAIKDTIIHVNGNRDVKFSGTAAGGIWDTSVASCSNLYCHSNAQGTGGVGTPSSFASPIWGSGALTCGSCHINMATDIAATGSHKKHANQALTNGMGYSCITCHGSGYSATTVAPATHVNKIINIAFFGIATTSHSHATYYKGSAAPGAGYAACSNIYCHSTVQGIAGSGAPSSYAAPTWGVTLNFCGDCHVNMATSASATGSHKEHAQTSGYSCNICHNGAGKDINTGAESALHANGFINIAFTGNGTGTVYSQGSHVPGNGYGTCSSNNCHGSTAVTPTWGSVSGKQKCEKCHGYRKPSWNALNGATATNDPKAGAHFNHISSTTYKYSRPFSCVECHSTSIALITDNVNAAGHFDTIAPAEVSFGSLARTGSITPTYVAGTCATNYCHGVTLADGATPSRVTPVWGTPFLTGASADCGKCHGNPPNTSGHSSVAADQCNACHSHVNNNRTFNDVSKHINGSLDGGISSGGLACFGCHGDSFYTGMVNNTLTYHHVLGGTAAPDQAPNTGTYPSSTSDVYCVSCHTDHNYFNANKGANLRTAIGAAGSSTANSDYVATGAGICLSCHTASLAKDQTNRRNSDGATTTIAINGAGYDVSAHQYGIATTFNGPSTFSSNCSKCHTDEQTKNKQTSAAKVGTHLSNARSLTAGLGLPAPGADQAFEENVCYRCHSLSTDTTPGGGTAKTTAGKDYYGSQNMATAGSENIFSDFQKTGGKHNVGGYNKIHTVSEQNATTGLISTKHVECGDCHNTHAATSTRHTAGTTGNTASGTLTGIGGATPAYSGAWTAPTSYTRTASATKEHEICFKCHNAANIGWGGAGAAAWTDIGLEFNPNNGSGHPIISPNASRPLPVGAMKAPWTNVGNQTMYCSDCHASDSASAQGPHGSAVKWMLKGTGKAWPYDNAAQNGTSTGTFWTIGNAAAGLFCLNCHNVLSNPHNAHGNHLNSEACVFCHIRVPHGGKIPRLISTTSMSAITYKRYYPDGNGSVPFPGSGAGSGLDLDSFTPTTGTYSKSSCESGCTGDHSTPGTQKW